MNKLIKKERINKPIVGKYADIPLKDLKEFCNIHDYYIRLINDVYNENKSTIPFDILLDMIDITPYSEIERFLLEKEDELGIEIEMGYFEELFDSEFLNHKYSENLQTQMKRFNLVPFKRSYTKFYVLSPIINREVIKPNYKKPIINDFSNLYDSPNEKAKESNSTAEELSINKFKESTLDSEEDIFLSTLKKEFGLNNLSIEIVYGTNKLFMDAIHYITENKFEYSVENIKITKKEELEKIIIDAILLGASDIYWDPKSDGVSISLSILNDEIPYKRLYFTDVERKEFESAWMDSSGIQAEKINWAKFPTRYGTIKELARMPEYTGRLQVTANANESLSIVIRITDKTKSITPLKDLNISDTRKEDFRQMIMNPTGIILVAGETGSGKTTTIYSILQELKRLRPTSRIEEVSKSIEVKIDEISQIEVADNEEGLGFEEVLEAETRRNAKVIYLSEINSPNSAKFAIDMAIASKLIITTIHTAKASFIPTRLRGITTNEKTLYKDFLESVVGLAHQVMLKEVCPQCKEIVNKATVLDINPKLPEILKAYNYLPEDITTVNNNPDCPICHGSGILVKKPIISVETLIVTEDIRQLLRDHEENPILELDRYLLTNYKTGLHDALKYVAEGKVSINYVYEKYAMWNITRDLYIPINNK